jgi:pyruvate-formate lyase
MEEVIKALRANWETMKMRQEFIEDAPKFGNDDDYADNIVERTFMICL